MPAAKPPTAQPLPAVPFYFMRHGQTDWNVARQIQGHTDVPLNPTGQAQAHSAAQTLKALPLGLIVCSPLKRAAVTATIVQEHLGLPLQTADGLKERHYGAFEGQFRHDILAAHNLTDSDDYHHLLPPDAEHNPMLAQRILTTLSGYLNGPTHPVLFVGHGSFMAQLCEELQITNRPHRFANAMPYGFTPSTTGWQLSAVAPSAVNAA